MENEEILDDLHDEDSEDVEFLKQEIEKYRSQAEKYKSRFKTEKAKQSQVASSEVGQVNVDELVNKKIAEQMFYQSNEVAKAHEAEIREYQTKYGLDHDKAFKLYLAETKPEALKKEEQATIDGHTQMQTDKFDDWKQMSDEEFDKKVMGFK